MCVVFLRILLPPRSTLTDTLVPFTTLFRAIARQDVATTQVEALVADFTKILEDNGGRMASSEYWGLRTLAYRIKKNRKGHYVMLRVDSPAAAMQELERNLRLRDRKSTRLNSSP